MTEPKKLSEQEISDLTKQAYKLRKNCITMIHNAASGHLGGAFSALDLMTVLFKKVIKHSCDSPKCEKRDRFVLSKGHASTALYAVLADCGYFDEKELMTFRKLGTKLQGHPCSEYVPGVEVPSGSLGQGLSLANGIALGLKLDKNPAKVFVILGDGECQEGQVWEAAMSSAHYKLDNVIAIIDRNRLQIDGNTEDVMALEPFTDKWKAFGWQVLEINGHDYQEIYTAYQQAIQLNAEKQAPVAIVANTVKGKGVSFMENDAKWHGTPPKDDEFTRAIEELQEKC